MSCDASRQRAWAKLGGSGTDVAAWLGLSAPQLLEIVYQEGRKQAASTNSFEQRRDHEVALQTGALFHHIKKHGLDLPTHSETATPRRASQYGYAAVQRCLHSIRADGRPLLAPERDVSAWWLWALGRSRPGADLEAMAAQHFDAYPELAALAGVPQDRYWHPEGDVWIHTCAVVDQAALIAARDKVTPHERLVLVFAALTHDLAKPQTTARKLETAAAGADGGAPAVGRGPDWEWNATSGLYERERITSYQHEEQGEPLAISFLSKLVSPAIIAEVGPLVRLHLQHIPLVHLERSIRQGRAEGKAMQAEQTTLDQGLQELARACAPSSLRQLSRLIEADMGGRAPWPPQNPCVAILARATELGIADGTLRNLPA